jgi:hypothetical protein
MIDPTWPKATVTDFRGSQDALDDCDIGPGRAKLSQNVEFFKGVVRTRYGYGTAYEADESTCALFNWISGLGNYLVWFSAGLGVRACKLTDDPPIAATIGAIATAGVEGASFAQSGPRLYVAPFGTAGAAVGAGCVVGYRSAAFFSDTMFAPPIAYTPAAPTEPSAGYITVGSHRIGYIIEHRSGYIGRPSPDVGTGTPAVQTFTPVTFVAAGSKNLSIVLNPTTWPTSAAKVHIIMSPVSNPNLYFFVPGATATVAGGASDPKTIVWSVADEDLIATGAEATDNLFFMSSTVAGTAPFNPSVLIPFGDRMGYVTTVNDINSNATGIVYFSNRNNHQQLSADKHGVQLPGQLDVITGFSMGSVVYLLGPTYIYATSDTGSDPVEWPLPSLVDGRRGTTAPRGVALSSTGQYAWVANESGLWLFDGSSYASLPVSYYNLDWKRINWAAAATLQLTDDPAAKRVYVLAALDGVSTPSHILTWDYTNGMTADRISYSLDVVGGSYAPSSICLVQNELVDAATAAKYGIEVWLGPQGAPHD